MKIGILTLPLHTNYGGILQAFALQTALEKMGHEVQVINLDRTPRFYSTPTVIKHFIALALSSIKRHKIYKYYDIRKEEQKRYRDYLIKSKFTQVFIEKYIHNYWVRNYEADIETAGFDAIVVGSDQIWSPTHAGAIGGVKNAFLPSIIEKDVVCLSYAASFGKDKWEYSENETLIAKESIKHFVAISVREITGVRLCKENLSIDAIHHVDPTMLLTEDDYVDALNLNQVQCSQGNLLVYILDSSKEKNNIVDYIESSLSLRRFIVNSKVEDGGDTGVSVEDCIQPPVEEWLRGFMDAEYVVTDSFHACVFSILFHKPFVVIGNMERGLTRFQFLLDRFGLTERLVSSLEDVKELDLHSSINYAEIERLLNEERNRSFSYLRKNLS